MTKWKKWGIKINGVPSSATSLQATQLSSTKSKKHNTNTKISKSKNQCRQWPIINNVQNQSNKRPLQSSKSSLKWKILQSNKSLLIRWINLKTDLLTTVDTSHPKKLIWTNDLWTLRETKGRVNTKMKSPKGKAWVEKWSLWASKSLENANTTLTWLIRISSSTSTQKTIKTERLELKCSVIN